MSRTTVSRTTTRLVAGTVALVLPLVAAAGCGAVKRRTIKQELSSARDHLYGSKALSMTLRLSDAKGNLLKSAASDDFPAVAAKQLIGGSVTYTVDPAGDKTLRDLSFSGDTSEAALNKSIHDVNLAIAVKDASTTVGEFRLVDGTLYARVDLTEIDRVAKLAGSDGVLSGFDDFVATHRSSTATRSRT